MKDLNNGNMNSFIYPINLTRYFRLFFVQTGNKPVKNFLGMLEYQSQINRYFMCLASLCVCRPGRSGVCIGRLHALEQVASLWWVKSFYLVTFYLYVIYLCIICFSTPSEPVKARLCNKTAHVIFPCNGNMPWFQSLGNKDVFHLWEDKKKGGGWIVSLIFNQKCFKHL